MEWYQGVFGWYHSIICNDSSVEGLIEHDCAYVTWINHLLDPFPILAMRIAPAAVKEWTTQCLPTILCSRVAIRKTLSNTQLSRLDSCDSRAERNLDVPTVQLERRT